MRQLLRGAVVDVLYAWARLPQERCRVMCQPVLDKLTSSGCWQGEACWAVQTRQHLLLLPVQ